MHTRQAALLAAVSLGGFLVDSSVPAFQPPASLLSREISRRHKRCDQARKVDDDDSSTLLKGDASDKTTTKAPTSLPLPPKKGGLFRRFRDTIDHIRDPGKYVLQLSRELGPIFIMYQYFSPVVVVGGQDNVMEFVNQREVASSVVHPQIPETLSILHTKWSTINLLADDPLFLLARDLFKDVLSSNEALSYHVKTMEPEVQRFVDNLAERVQENPHQEFFMAVEVRELSLQLFSKTFTGQGLTKEQMELYNDYNAALFTLFTQTPLFAKAQHALKVLKKENWRRFQQLQNNVESMDAPGKYFCSKVCSFPDFYGPEMADQIGSIIVLFIWGSYIQTAGLAVKALAWMATTSQQDNRDTGKKNHVHGRVLAEFQQQQQKQQKTSSSSGASLQQSDLKFWFPSGMPYTRGVMRELLRIDPPSGGSLPRYSKQDFVLAGYRIPAGIPVTLDPRIGYADEALYPQSHLFEPDRWVSKADTVTDSASSRCPFQGAALSLGRGSFFPGGYGAHQCPGIALAELFAILFVAKMAERFESWEYSGSGLNPQDGSLQFTNIPTRLLTDDFGLKFKLRRDITSQHG